MSIEEQAQSRRTFAIISHPDAGKTTLTEKLLLYANAIHLAGSIKARRATRHAVSDWMQMEQERGISVTSSVLQFVHQGRALNLLDTPGHADFSEDTFRTLAAVDSAVMLMDHSKGVEPRTQKLFDVCRMRRLPVVTFMNKLDRAGMEPLQLLDQVSASLNLKLAPMTWPLGMGRDFKGVVDIATRDLLLFDAQGHGAHAIRAERVPWAHAERAIGASMLEKVGEELDILAAAGDRFTTESFLAGEVSPVYWGSAMTNFGVEMLLDFLVRQAPAPSPRATESGEVVSPCDSGFTGFVFKMQANMNPRHRDRIAFLRVVSGRFERGMDAVIGRSGETIRLTKPHFFLAQERSLIEEAWPGDIVGLHDAGKLRVGDTVSTRGALRFDGIPRFAPEHFGQMNLADPLKRKALDAGLEQLALEGVVQIFLRPALGRQSPILGAVGLLQFEVLKERLKNEYSVNARFEPLAFNHARWVGGAPEGLSWLKNRRDYMLVEDSRGNPVLLAESNWAFTYALEHAPGLALHDVEPL